MNYERQTESLSMHPSCLQKMKRMNPENGGSPYETLQHKHIELIHGWKRTMSRYRRRGCKIFVLRKHAKNYNRHKDRLSMHENTTCTATEDADGGKKCRGNIGKSLMLRKEALLGWRTSRCNHLFLRLALV